ncbi:MULTISPECIES: SWIM zinc finger family protein [unclassified Pseudoalteromonas]|uniref:SWIM zinc finger family protein n=1 Tax=unclassified Pseudoalteromonas TaxID=194690 RepID=UPI0025B31F68|nr:MULTISPECIES: SWIM zinc finger family protein [unclassified Pseudoalteromonas]MDN3380482.1 SWIM zinc finger family protein [Pseudoalteromonas sp. APC 3893]MDN3388864.1 SWIM zinc finger family protein [Pseudoalteromonas sp. APC 4017]
MFDLNNIQQRASSKTYDLGYGLFASNHVSNLLIIDHQIMASVAGQFKYKVTLENDAAGQCLASCTCPAADYQEICKHAIAVALKVNSLSAAELADADANDETAQDNERSELITWFLDKPSDELTNIIMDFLDESEHEYDKWLMMMSNDKQALGVWELSKLITKALPEEQVWDWNEVSGYFADADSLFELIFPAIAKLPVEQQWQLNLKALVRLNDVLEGIDDSGGFRYEIEGQLNQNLSELFNQLSWPDEQKAQWIFEHFADYKYDVFPSVPHDFNITPSVNTLFLSQCATAVEKRLQTGVDFDDWKQKSALTRLTSVLIDQAQEQDDWQEQLRLIKLTAHDSDDYLKIAALCKARNDLLDAEYYLKQAYQRAHKPHELLACKRDEIALRLELSEFKAAWAIAWQLFVDNPSFNGFKDLQTLQLKTGIIDAEFTQKVDQLLLSLSDKAAKSNQGAYRFTNYPSELLDFYIDQNEIEKARSLAAKHEVKSSQLITLAGLIMAQYPQESIDLYHKSLRNIIGKTNNDAYREATNLLIKIEKNLKDTNADCTLLYDMIAALIKDFKQKRNMMKLLREYFPECFK